MPETINNQDITKDILFEVVDLLDKHNIPYWLDYGTLLGATREGDFIPWDVDADISCFEEDKEKILKLIPELEKIFLISIRAFNNTAIVVCTKEKSEEDKKIPHLDIFFWHKEGKMLKRKAYVGLDSPTGTDTNKGRDFPIEWVSQFASLPIGDKMLSVPKNPVFFCEFRYGKSWITPMTIPNWNRLDSKENLTIKPE